MKRIHTIALGISAVALGIGGLATAQGAMHHGGGHGERGMKMLDTNNDGIITRAEAQAGASAMFTKMDVNKDGKLDQTDRDQARALKQDEMFKKIDANSDGSISRTEFAAHHGAGRGHEGMDGPGMMDGKGKDGGKHGRMGGRMGGHGGGMMAMAKMADTNNDGAISQAEFGAAAIKHFDMADTNRDGKVTAEEQKAARAAMKAQMKAQMKAKWQADKPAGN